MIEVTCSTYYSSGVGVMDEKWWSYTVMVVATVQCLHLVYMKQGIVPAPFFRAKPKPLLGLLCFADIGGHPLFALQRRAVFACLLLLLSLFIVHQGSPKSSSLLLEEKKMCHHEQWKFLTISFFMSHEWRFLPLLRASQLADCSHRVGCGEPKSF